jgi:biotin transport system substrate-specific component
LVANIVFVYTLGILGLAWRAAMSIRAAFAVNLAFIPADLVKIALAGIAAAAVHRAFPDLLAARISWQPGVVIELREHD